MQFGYVPGAGQHGALDLVSRHGMGAAEVALVLDMAPSDIRELLEAARQHLEQALAAEILSSARWLGMTDLKMRWYLAHRDGAGVRVEAFGAGNSAATGASRVNPPWETSCTLMH